MTRHFSKWAEKQKLSMAELFNALSEVQEGVVEARLGGKFDFRGTARVAALERLFVTKREIELSSFMDLPRTKSRIYLKRSW